METWPRYEENAEIDQFTRDLESLALEIGRVALENQKEYFIGGGLAIDFCVGKITRNHHDIDFHPMLSDIDFWLNWFKSKGYKVRRRLDKDFPETYKVKSNTGEPIVDIWPFKLEGEILLINHNGKYEDAGRHWKEVKIAEYNRISLKIENPQRVLEQKLRHTKHGQPLRKQDFHDFKVLGRDSGIST